MVARKLSIAEGGVGISVGIAVRRLVGGRHAVSGSENIVVPIVVPPNIDVAAAPGFAVVVAAAPGS
jgi:hypothetical protein